MITIGYMNPLTVRQRNPLTLLQYEKIIYGALRIFNSALSCVLHLEDEII